MKAFFHHFSRALAILAVLAFVGFSETTEAYTHHEKSCAVHSHGGDSVDHADCKDTGKGHEHSAKDSCSLGHCHTNCGNTFPQAKFVLQTLAPLKIASLSSAVSAYLNPYLGLPLQPPRA